MDEYIVKILNIEDVTHDVKRFRLEKPIGYEFNPGQATEISINQQDYQTQTRPFTFTGLNTWNFLEFTIKIYKNHQGVTSKLATLKNGDELIIHDVWGKITYNGPGVFIAGGAGITPFIAILRDLASKNEIGGNKLIFANKTRSDIILEGELKKLLGLNFTNVLSHEQAVGYLHGFITEELIKANISNANKMIYLCGPPPMMTSVEKLLNNLQIDLKWIIKEEF